MWLRLMSIWKLSIWILLVCLIVRVFLLLEWTRYHFPLSFSQTHKMWNEHQPHLFSDRLVVVLFVYDIVWMKSIYVAGVVLYSFVSICYDTVQVFFCVKDGYCRGDRVVFIIETISSISEVHSIFLHFEGAEVTYEVFICNFDALWDLGFFYLVSCLSFGAKFVCQLSNFIR